MKDEFEAEVSDSSYSGWNGWVDETFIAPLEGEDFDDRIKLFVGKKVKIAIQEIE